MRRCHRIIGKLFSRSTNRDLFLQSWSQFVTMVSHFKLGIRRAGWGVPDISRRLDQIAILDRQMLRVQSFKKTLAAGPYQFVRLVEIHVIGGRSFIAGKPIDGVVGDVDTCAKCGSKLRFSYVIQARNGLRFAVGSSCLRKLGLPHSALKEAKKAELEVNRRRRKIVEQWRAARLYEKNGAWFRDPFTEWP